MVTKPYEYMNITANHLFRTSLQPLKSTMKHGDGSYHLSGSALQMTITHWSPPRHHVSPPACQALTSCKEALIAAVLLHNKHNDPKLDADKM
jgi:hypothetical protein